MNYTAITTKHGNYYIDDPLDYDNAIIISKSNSELEEAWVSLWDENETMLGMWYKGNPVKYYEKKVA